MLGSLGLDVCLLTSSLSCEGAAWNMQHCPATNRSRMVQRVIVTCQGSDGGACKGRRQGCHAQSRAGRVIGRLARAHSPAKGSLPGAYWVPGWVGMIQCPAPAYFLMILRAGAATSSSSLTFSGMTRSEKCSLSPTFKALQATGTGWHGRWSCCFVVGASFGATAAYSVGRPADPTTTGAATPT